MKNQRTIKKGMLHIKEPHFKRLEELVSALKHDKKLRYELKLVLGL